MLPHDAAASMKQQFFDLDPAGLYVVFVCVCLCMCMCMSGRVVLSRENNISCTAGTNCGEIVAL